MKRQNYISYLNNLTSILLFQVYADNYVSIKLFSLIKELEELVQLAVSSGQDVSSQTEALLSISIFQK